MGKIKVPLFNKETDDLIISLIKKYGHLFSPYVNVSRDVEKLISKRYTPKQIRQRWTNNLDPNLCHDDLDDDEKEFIIQWAEKHKKIGPNGITTICWKYLIPAMEKEFGKLRAENRLKNFWHSKKRSLNPEARIDIPPSLSKFDALVFVADCMYKRDFPEKENFNNLGQNVDASQNYDI